MRIAYVHLGAPLDRAVGVTRKIVGQLRVWRARGHDVQLFVQTYAASGLSARLLSEARVTTSLFVDDRIAGVGALRAARRRLGTVRALSNAVRAWAPTLVYVRFSVAFNALVRLSRDIPTVLEVNSDDLREWWGHLSWYKYLYHRITRARLLQSADGLVFVTHELAGRPHFLRHARATAVIGNGVDLSDARPAPPPPTSRPRVAFVGEPGFPWHGVDKLAVLARSCGDWDFDVMGYGPAEIGAQVPPNMCVHGYLSPERSASVLAGADVAVGSLAFHRIGLTEACPLKVRQYLAQGIPTIITHRDTDFPDGAWFLLRLPNAPDNVAANIAAIRQFVVAVKGRRVSRAEIQHLDTEVKEGQRLEFFERVVRDREPGPRVSAASA